MGEMLPSSAQPLAAGRARAETRVRAFIDFLSGLYGDVPEWDK